ncbi:phosphotransferase [Actinoplanes sp. L3-i22]|uniref:phosphotransferase n=1 Tax=Actinoplanes sp. L3-i22 TaxID=2836373 RepID=UPI001C7779F5|nr:phosphotransferase [Actinoplanes sp. L3-i22]BCY11038.1 trifolitoxin immunity domain-containing protein [Actinoplanes sp. L3-i22]
MTDPMLRGRFARPIRRGEAVERLMGPGAQNVHALLDHFAQVGFQLAPRRLGTTADGTREILSHLPGDTGYPLLTAELRSDDTLVEVVRVIRDMHDATQGFVAPRPGRWHRLEPAVPAVIDCIGHHDLTPWNLVFDGTTVVGIIDWDLAGPSNRVWDLAYAAHHWIPLHPPDGLAGFGWGTEPDRAGRLRLLTDSYGRGVRPEQVVDFAVLRLLGMAAHIDDRVHAGDPAFAVHRDEDHAAGYRRAADYVLADRDRLLGAAGHLAGRRSPRAADRDRR